MRDTPGILDVGLPCFCAAVTPNSPAKNGPETVNLPVIVGGVNIEAGDLVVGDVDGVVVVPHARIDAVIARLEDIQAKEDATMAAVEAGLGVPGTLKNCTPVGVLKRLTEIGRPGRAV